MPQAPAPPGASRSVPIAVGWSLLAALCGLGAVSAWPFGVVLGWPAASLALVALAYLRGDPHLFGKRPDGALGWRSRPHHWPYLGLTLGILRLVRRFSREPVYHAILPDLLLGRRPGAHELPPGTTLLVDLTAELSAPLARRVAAYASVPALDGTAPPLDAFTALVERVATHEGTAYVHCAFGHGRSACVVAAVLVLRGRARDAAEAFGLVKRERPFARMSPTQWQLLRAWEARRACASGA